ncbi:MAG: hypothetical protein PHU61_00425 [Candidatus Absconditabacteria bacterium]|nr:hypothetical protein [Candidatus Absconditabacteria bacterium]MDD3868562.1 hypothetical protein [Candidatus Absconditabacteria bacterium]MDD4714126.1 hypothetical protein [Candidatus Absconditabacteria bacterium]
MNEVAQKIITLPSDDELYTTFMAAAQEGAHDNIKGIVKQISGFLDSAKGEVKRIIIFDPNAGMSLKFDMQTGNDVLKGFVDCQNFLVKGGLKLLMAANGAQTFDSFIAKMKKTEENINVTRGTLTRILTTFFDKLSQKYAILETNDSIAIKVNALFGINDASVPEKWTKVDRPQ